MVWPLLYLRHGRRALVRHTVPMGPVLGGTTLPDQETNKSRTFATTKGGGDKKNSAMKRQLQRNPAPSLPQHPVLPPSSTTSFNIYNTATPTPIVPSAQFSQPSPLGSPIQAVPVLTWETDKSTLSSLPDEAASLLDKEELFDPSIHLPYAPKDWTGYEPATPLSDFLMSRIGVSGRAITTAEYMRHALTHPTFGYYTNPPTVQQQHHTTDFETEDWLSEAHNNNNNDNNNNDNSSKSTTPTASSLNDSTLIGPRGDFITAPEVSHVFGHCLCVWFVTQWQSPLLNKPEQIQLVELGPGRGTLITDILELATASTLQDFGKTIGTIHLVEASRVLRGEQEAALKERLGHLIDFTFVHVSSSLSSSSSSLGTMNTMTTTPIVHPPPPPPPSTTTTSVDVATTTTKTFSIRVEWHDTFASFSKNRDSSVPVFVVAQEFLDALPVHSFQKTDEGWRERLIDVASVLEDGDDNHNSNHTKNKKEGVLRPRLRQVLAPDVTPALALFVEGNPQYDSAPTGSVIEICPEALLLVEDIATVLEESRGVALLIDYGQDGTADTLRAFSNHTQVPLTSLPGQVDVTADVDFFALRTTVNTNKSRNSRGNPCSPDRQIHAFGPVPQGKFLMRMGVAEMVIKSIEDEDTSPERAQALSDALKFLVLPEHMGETFKVLALAPKKEGLFAPAGMEQ
jgi:NADH dehydrogenase [ubiquinone] 1 alpha subcomplex assembly factor 7